MSVIYQLHSCCFTSITSYCAGRSNLRPTSLNQLHVPPTTTCYGDRGFFINGPAVWNSLLVDLRSLDTSLDIFRDIKNVSFQNCLLDAHLWPWPICSV